MINFFPKIINFFRVLGYNIIEAKADKREAYIIKMNTNKFEISISEQCYKMKPTSSDYAKMKFKKEELTLSEFCDKISQGYSFCHIFKENKRKNENFLYTNFVCIDVDDSDISLFDFLCTIDVQPTIAYNTFSNGIDDLYAFRLLYFFENEITKELYPILYDSICTQIGLSETKDNCGRKIAQLMNGNSRDDVELIKSERVYVFSTFINKDVFPKKSLEYNNNTHIHVNSNETNGNTNCTKERVQAIKTLQQGVQHFLNHYSHIEIISESLLEYEDGYCILDETYVLLPMRMKWTNKKAQISKYRDGEQRRRRLYLDAFLIRKIKIDISFVELLYNLVIRRKLFYDNSDGTLTDFYLISVVDSILKLSENDLLKLKNTKHAKFKTDRNWCTLNNISRRSYSR